MTIKRILRVFITSLALLALLSVGGANLYGQSTPRPYHLGFTPFPSNYFEESSHNLAFVANAIHGDILSLFYQDGIPWPQAIAGSGFDSYPESLRAIWHFQRLRRQTITPNHKLYLAMNPMDAEYRGLAKLWGEQTQMPLEAPWDGYSFDHPDVKQAVLNYAIEMIEYFQPDYFCFAVEANILLDRRPDLWNAYKDFHRHLYIQLKQRYPSLPVFASIQYEHLNGRHRDAQILVEQVGDAYPDVLILETAEIVAYGDLLSLSTYPNMVNWLNLPYEGPAYFNQAFYLADALGKQIGIEQTGWNTEDLPTESGHVIAGSDDAQTLHIGTLLQLALERNFAFVMNFVPIDYGENYGTSFINLGWAYTGLLRQDGSQKPALSVWEQYRSLPVN